jgi:hypothetical protein
MNSAASTPAGQSPAGRQAPANRHQRTPKASQGQTQSTGRAASNHRQDTPKDTGNHNQTARKPARKQPQGMQEGSRKPAPEAGRTTPAPQRTPPDTSGRRGAGSPQGPYRPQGLLPELRRPITWQKRSKLPGVRTRLRRLGGATRLQTQGCRRGRPRLRFRRVSPRRTGLAEAALYSMLC